jgi:NTP pyrophosphatase (non-canonical NTP hydrolase)
MTSLREFQEIFKKRFGEIDRRSGDLFLLSVLMEEVGELAESIRRDKDFEEEFADVLFILISLANLKGVDLERVLNEKYVKRDFDHITGSWDDIRE